MKRIMGVLLVAALCVPAASCGGDDRIGIPKQPTVINVTVEANGIFRYGGRVSIPVARNQTVRWTCNYPFALYFGADSCFVKDSKGVPGLWGETVRGIQSEKNDSGEKPVFWQELTVSENALSRIYKYTIAVYRDGRIWIDDPEHIIEPPGR